MSNLYILNGLAASGKSSWAKRHFDQAYNPKTHIVSRDEIRFSKLSDGESYFAHEKEVLHDYYQIIHNLISAGDDVVADATQLSAKRVRDTVNCLGKLKGSTHIVLVRFDTSLQECLRRNSKRVGREHVPDNVIQDMDRRLLNIYTIMDDVPQIDEVWRIRTRGADDERRS